VVKGKAAGKADRPAKNKGKGPVVRHQGKGPRSK
jgi:hypothetical protein